jgi:hypothetical protein
MAKSREDLTQAMQVAVRHFWRTRARQAGAQGSKSGDRDRGARSAVTGGAHLDGFAELIRNLTRLSQLDPEKDLFVAESAGFPPS